MLFHRYETSTCRIHEEALFVYKNMWFPLIPILLLWLPFFTVGVVMPISVNELLTHMNSDVLVETSIFLFASHGILLVVYQLILRKLKRCIQEGKHTWLGSLSLDIHRYGPPILYVSALGIGFALILSHQV